MALGAAGLTDDATTCEPGGLARVRVLPKSTVLSGLAVVVVVPARDEAPRVGRVIRSLPPEVDHVVVVDDGSRDGTGEAVRAAGDPRVVLVTHDQSRGVGASIVSGYRQGLSLVRGARAAFVVMAGDGQMAPEDLPAVVSPLASGDADYVKGCRFDWPDAEVTMPIGRRLGGEVFSRLTSLAIGQRIRDSQCGFTAVTAEALGRLDLDGLWPSYGYPNDLLGQLAARRLRIAEVPVRPIYADEVSRLRLRHLPRIVALIVRAWRRRVTSWRSGP